MSTKKIFVLFAIITFVFSSCSDWLNTTSKSDIREEEYFATIDGFQQSLIGCYISMRNESLYGSNLSFSTLEILGCQFEPYKTNLAGARNYSLQRYDYTQSEVVDLFNDIWAKSYNVVANVNEALKYIDQNRHVLDEINYHVIKGELLAIRAYMHFDLLRLYGYGDWERRTELGDKLMIPYCKVLSKEPTSRSTGKEVLSFILSDLSEAESLLKDYDPITGKHEASFYAEVNMDNFFKQRTGRLNYYAVKGLQSRVLLWEGSKESKSKALHAALEVISKFKETGINILDMSTEVRYLDANEITISKTSLAIENLFYLDTPALETSSIFFIHPAYLDTDYYAMFLLRKDVNLVYEGYSEDVRLYRLLVENFMSSTNGFVPLKVYQKSLDYSFKGKVSMIRLPEIFYIAAECYATGASPDINKALEMLNFARQKRGLFNKLENLTVEQIIDEIRKEYRKEFLSEGVMFYYYKRTGAVSIPNVVFPMTDEQYVLPNPDYND